MIETIPNMPPGTFGFRAHGHITPQDYRDVVLPPLRTAVAAGEQLRVLVAVGPEFREEPAAAWEALKADVELGVRHRQAWERVAVVSDMSWVRRASELFAWMMPGELRAFPEHELETAKVWLGETLVDAFGMPWPAVSDAAAQALPTPLPTDGQARGERALQPA